MVLLIHPQKYMIELRNFPFHRASLLCPCPMKFDSLDKDSTVQQREQGISPLIQLFSIESVTL